jgi:hypothetical protein
MGKQPTSGWLQRTNLLVGIAVGVVAVIGGIVALLARGGGPSDVDRYRSKLHAEVCLGDLAAASTSSNWLSYTSGTSDQIDKPAWLSAMGTTRSHLVAAGDRLQQLKPPHSLYADWQGSIEALTKFTAFWDDFRTHTESLPENELTVFTYPGADWQSRLTASEAAVGVPLGRLIGKRCETTTPSSSP